ncbi:MAG: DnaT-like ssDNA-binding domain-containing protein [Pseudomonadales bacterium]
MSSLIPERTIVISPSLATTIGLEEAVLLQLLNDAAVFGQDNSKQGYQWFTIQRVELQALLPFWDNNELQRISKSLKDKGVILINSPPLNHCDHLSFAMNEQTASNITPPTVSISASMAPTAANKPATRGAGLLADNWQPDEDLLQLLALNHNIPRAFALQQREDFVLYWRERQQVSHSWHSKFRQHVLKEWRFLQSRQAAAISASTQSNDIKGEWQPSPDALEILLRTDVSPDFIEDAIPEFVLYWRERGEVSSTWNSKFIAHIRRQWAKYTQALELDYEPRQIASNWQPNEDVYDILRLANIDIDFSRQLVPEFVLFWRDTKEIQRSWNTKFLQHTKYQWATRHNMEQVHARQSIDHQPGQAKDGSLIKRLTDRSWAKGIVEGI